MNKVLFVAYFFPPLGGVGSIRLSKFVKYLPTHGWSPIVVTPKKTSYPLKDESLLKDIPNKVRVIRVGYFDLANIFSNRYWQALFNYLIYPLFLIPDRQILWLPSAFWSARKVVKNERVRVIFTSSSPTSTHLLGYLLKKIYGVYWVADFRDEWSQNPFKKYPTIFHRRLEEKLEKVVVRTADKIIGATKPIGAFLSDLTEGSKTSVITNGFDEEDFSPNLLKVKRKAALRIVHTGSLYCQSSVDNLLKAVKNLGVKDVEIKFIGGKNFVSHDQAVLEMRRADVLLILLSPKPRPAVITGKVFEYLAARKPILLISPKGTEVAKLVTRLKVGEVAQPDNIEEITRKLKNLYLKWQKNNLSIPYINIKEYERRNLAEKLAEIFNFSLKQERLHLLLIGNLQSPQNRNLCQYLKEKNYKISFITTKPAKLSCLRSYYLGEVNFTPWYFLKSLIKIRSFIQDLKPDIVHGQDLVFSGIWAYLSGFRPYVVTTWGSDVFNYSRFIAPERLLVKKTLQKADLVTGSSLALKNQAMSIANISTRWQLFHFGIDLKRFPSRVQKKTQIIFCPRSIGPIYNIDVLIKAFACLAKRDKKIKLHLINNIQDESYYEEIKKYIETHRLENRVTFLPKVDNKQMIKYYDQSEVVVSITSSDGCSVSFLEAMALKKKIVASDLPYIKEWFRGNNLFIVPVGNIAKTAREIERALAFSSQKWAKIGQANRQLVIEKAEIKANINKLDQFYRGLIR